MIKNVIHAGNRCWLYEMSSSLLKKHGIHSSKRDGRNLNHSEQYIDLYYTEVQT